MKSFHVAFATTETLQHAFDTHDIAMIDHIIERRRMIGEDTFTPITSEDGIRTFIERWGLNY